MNENEVIRNVIESEIKRKYKNTKEKLIAKLFKPKTEDEYNKIQQKLLTMEQEYENEITELYKETTIEDDSSKQESCITVQHDIKAEDDNNFVAYIKNLKQAVEQYLNKINTENKQEDCNINTTNNESNIILTNNTNTTVKQKCEEFINLDLHENRETYKKIDEILQCIYENQKNNSFVYNNLKIPLNIYNVLFEYQKDCVKWFYNHFVTKVGCILADEMGLGKTLQVIAYLSGMIVSNKISNILIVVPSTIVNQWILEWKRFFPFVRIFVLHKTYTKNMQELKKSILKTNKVLIVSYDGFKNEKKFLENIKFDYIILDEGHKIKNKNSKISKMIKKFCNKTDKHEGLSVFNDSFDFTHKIVMTGTPIQNNLQELWNIFDFINPNLLGTLTDFIEEYEEPIKRGGYVNASKESIEKAYKTAMFLKSLIEPHILRRIKSQVAKQLPKKIDKILFCELTKKQEIEYKKVLESDFVYKILLGKVNCLSGLMTLRKIINHPNLHNKKDVTSFEDDIINSAGKMIKLENLLCQWKSENKKVLIFTQFVKMLKILEDFCNFKEYTYVKMDGQTTLKTRIDYINKFNSDKDVFIFLLTTRVGGLGLNLVGANRVVIYDPDWNPSTDTQAKERAWRYGQKEEVEIYRFVTINTLEEKIYKRQVFKSHLSDKILKNIKNHKLFEKDDINDLFTYSKDSKNKNKLMYNEVKEESDNINDIETDLLVKLDIDTKTKYETIKNKLEILRKKQLLSDEEMIEYISLRENYNEKDLSS
ncbi:DNA excision repair protein ERCC-6 [Binucleata daphniae]